MSIFIPIGCNGFLVRTSRDHQKGEEIKAMEHHEGEHDQSCDEDGALVIPVEVVLLDGVCHSEIGFSKEKNYKSNRIDFGPQTSKLQLILQSSAPV